MQQLSNIAHLTAASSCAQGLQRESKDYPARELSTDQRSVGHIPHLPSAQRAIQIARTRVPLAPLYLSINNSTTVMSTRRLPLLALLLLTLACARTVAATPDETASRFYRWYLSELNADRDPFAGKGRDTLKRYVTSHLLRAIDRKRNSADGLDADPFLSVQDWSKEWATTLLATREIGGGPVASVTIIMQSSDMGNLRLRLRMKKKNGEWQIDSVVALKPQQR